MGGAVHGPSSWVGAIPRAVLTSCPPPPPPPQRPHKQAYTGTHKCTTTSKQTHRTSQGVLGTKSTTNEMPCMSIRQG